MSLLTGVLTANRKEPQVNSATNWSGFRSAGKKWKLL